MNKNRIIAYLLGVICLILTALGYIEYIDAPGFPDGHLTEYDRAVKGVFQIVVFPAAALGLYFLYLGWISSKKETGTLLTVAAVILVLMIIIFCFLNGYLYSSLNHGQGG